MPWSRLFFLSVPVKFIFECWERKLSSSLLTKPPCPITRAHRHRVLTGILRGGRSVAFVRNVSSVYISFVRTTRSTNSRSRLDSDAANKARYYCNHLFMSCWSFALVLSFQSEVFNNVPLSSSRQLQPAGSCYLHSQLNLFFTPLRHFFLKIPTF
jgi:hypothetical protein